MGTTDQLRLLLPNDIYIFSGVDCLFFNWCHYCECIIQEQLLSVLLEAFTKGQRKPSIIDWQTMYHWYKIDVFLDQAVLGSLQCTSFTCQLTNHTWNDGLHGMVLECTCSTHQHFFSTQPLLCGDNNKRNIRRSAEIICSEPVPLSVEAGMSKRLNMFEMYVGLRLHGVKNKPRASKHSSTIHYSTPSGVE